MKKILYNIIMCAVLALTSCSKEELPTVGGQNPDDSYTFNIGIEEPDYAPQTRARVTMGRYLMEMYEGSLSATPVKMENTNGVFNVELKKGVDYVCLFWADGGAADYDATNLKAVKQTDETKTGTAAYCASVTVNSKTFDGAIKLRRAVAELSFIDKNGLNEASNALKITYPYASTTLNVGNGTVTYAAGTAVRTITGITPPAQATDAFTTDFVLAPKEAEKLMGLKFQLNTEAEITIAETAVQANFRTKITGEYWKDVPIVGSYYYDDTTFSTEYDTKGGTRTCIGIVFVVNADGKSGKIVSLDEYSEAWGPSFETGATSETDGAANTTRVLTLGSYTANKDQYPIFKWCEEKRNSGVNWYIPAKDELLELINAKDAVNPSLATCSDSSNQIDPMKSPGSYCSSTESSDANVYYYIFMGFRDVTKSNKGNTRAISVF